jgi:hypothetical protein
MFRECYRTATVREPVAFAEFFTGSERPVIAILSWILREFPWANRPVAHAATLCSHKCMRHKRPGQSIIGEENTGSGPG